MTDKLEPEHKIQVLENISAVQKRPGMYVGDVEGDTTHLAVEVLDNAIDEVLRKKATSIYVGIDTKENIYSVADDGGGLPVHIIHGNEKDNTKDRDSVEVTFTVLHSSGKFDNSVYKNSGGLHGVGLVCVNALSEYTTVYIRKDKCVYYKYQFIEGVLKKDEKHPTGRQLVKLPESKSNFSTKVEWKPSSKYYKNTQSVDLKVILDKLQLVGSMLKPKTYVNDKLLENLPIGSLIKQSLISKLDTNDDPFFKLENILLKDKVTIYFTFTETDINFVNKSEVNLIPCTGKFLKLVTTLFVKSIKELIPVNITTKDVTKYLKLWISVRMTEPVFSGQTKEKMDKSLAKLINPLKPQLTSLFQQKPHLKLVITRIKNSKLKSETKTSSKISNDNPLVDCLSSHGDILYICEGKSAMSSIKPIRNRKNEAIFPLTGKIMNSANFNFEELINSKKISFLCEAVGINMANPLASKYRYDKYKIIADADSDGYHIIMLVITYFAKFAPSIIKEGKLSIIQTPLWGYIKKGKLVPLFFKDDVTKARESGIKLVRFKGLGEFNPTQLKPLLNKDRVEYIVKWPETSKEHELILKLISDTTIKKHVKSNMGFNKQLLINKTLSQ